MGFWGIEVKPGKPYPYHSDNVRGTLHITQATLGLGSSKERSIVQCSVGHKKPIFLCALLPNKNESCSLDLEFDEDDLVAFSVIGPQSVHLSGYFVANEGEFIRDDYESDSLGEDIAETETDSSEYNTKDDYGDDDEESEDGFVVGDDDDYDMYPSSNVPNSGVIIEEIVDDDNPNGDDQTTRPEKKKHSRCSLEDTNSQHKIVVRKDASILILESEDEDGFPISTTQKSESNQKFRVDALQTDDKIKENPKKKGTKESDNASNSKRKVENVEQDGQPDSQKRKKKKKKHLELQVKENADQKQPKENEVVKRDEQDHKSSNEKTTDVEIDATPGENQPENKKKKKNKKKTEQENIGATHMEKSVTPRGQQSRSMLETEEKQTEAKPSKTRTFPNGLVVEEVAMGKPDGKRASPGKQVSVRYIGKLKNGKIFDSNVGRAPFKFRLGLGQVIAGWDVGVDGMRVGDKRRLTIPPSMGYGSKGAGGKIPPNSWLLFDVELIDVR